MVQYTDSGVGSPRQGRAGLRPSSRDEDFCVPHLKSQGLCVCFSVSAPGFGVRCAGALSRVE